MIVIKIRPKGENVWLVQTPEELISFIKDASHDTGKYDIIICEMSQIEIQNLKEFDGW